MTKRMKPPLPYVGGKFQLAKTIVDLFPPHNAYCEVFGGGLHVTFRKEPEKSEIVNDIDKYLVTFYRVIQNHFDEFLRQFEFFVPSREIFEDWREQMEIRGLTDIQIAAKYYYLQKQCFAGKVRGRSFGTSIDRPARIKVSNLKDELKDTHKRLAGTTIENLPWRQFIERYSCKEGVLSYLDPPYLDKPYYTSNLYEKDFREMAEVLSSKKMKGMFLMSLNDHPIVRDIFKKFDIIPVSLNYSCSKKGGTVGKELLIKNY